MKEYLTNLLGNAGCEALSPTIEAMSHSVLGMSTAATILASVAVFFLVVLCVSCATAFFILFLTKTGIRDRIVATAPKLISELFSCDFCLSWWTGLLLCIIMAIMSGDWAMLIAAACTAPIARRLVA